jgi:hypothetical protein
MPCGYLGRIIGHREDFEIHRCEKLLTTCVQFSELLDRMPGSDAKACDKCSEFTDGPTLPDDLKYLACLERGKTTGEQIHCQCGIDRTIYACGVKQKCLKRLPPGRYRESFPDSLAGITVCSECDSART